MPTSANKFGFVFLMFSELPVTKKFYKMKANGNSDDI